VLKPMNLRGTRARVAVGLAAAVAIGIQLIPPVTPTATLPGAAAMTEILDVPGPVEAILRKACHDCHSPETRWPWYARVAPISWYVAKDVQHGRSNLDFSRWSTDPDREPTPLQRLRWMCEDVLVGSMPPRLYRLAHPDARLTEEEQRQICAWTARVRRELQER
jgi:hypothetical protein